MIWNLHIQRDWFRSSFVSYFRWTRNIDSSRFYLRLLPLSLRRRRSLFAQTGCLFAYIVSVSMLIGFGLQIYQAEPFLERFPQGFAVVWPAVAVFLGLLIITEGAVAYRSAHVRTSPALVVAAAVCRSDSGWQTGFGFCRCSFSCPVMV